MCYLEIKLLSLPGMIFAQFKTFGDMYNVGLQPTEGLPPVGRRLRSDWHLSFAEKVFYNQIVTRIF